MRSLVVQAFQFGVFEIRTGTSVAALLRARAKHVSEGAVLPVKSWVIRPTSCRCGAQYWVFQRNSLNSTVRG